ncbi:MAG: tRNA pseudouridine(55) synthase TruB [Treponema sp.]|nr:tRNA pseudouridine(55) synthase TruB [Treponema sp.]
MKSGLILLNKSAGCTSFDALYDIKKSLNTSKVGHTGTLDRFACGLLVILAGRALKLGRWFSHCDKKYEGRIHFGIETDTLDPEGKEIARAGLPSRKEIEEVLHQFTGEIMQEPPVYSAIHVNGQRASDLAREGKTPKMLKRAVTVYKLELLSYTPPFADIFVHCSSGTYIRSLARDIALAAGSRAHLCGLLRTQVAGFKLGINNNDSGLPLCVLHPVDKYIISLLGMPYFEVTQREAKDIFHGKPLDSIVNGKILIKSDSNALCAKETAAVFFKDTLVAVIENKGNGWKYGCVFAE